MRHKRFLLVVLGAAAVIATAVIAQRRAEDVPVPQLPEEGHFVSALGNLWKESTVKDRDLLWRLFTALSALARNHGLNPVDAIIPGVRPDEVSIATFQDGRVVILRGWDHFIPGKDTQHLLLLDRKGRCLDRLSCSINARLTRMVVGSSDSFRTDVLAAPEADGAWLVIRYSRGVSGNFSHQVTHEGKTHSYHWGQDGPKAGLCRVGIRDGKFDVLFPGPQGGR